MVSPLDLVRTRRALGVVVVAATVLLGAVLSWEHGRPDRAAAQPAPTADPSVPGTPVAVGDTSCGDGWSGGPAGTTRFAVWNTSIYPVEVYVQDLATKKVYLDVENLGTGATRAAAVDLAPGRYEFVCLPAEGEPVHGEPQEVTGQRPDHVTAGVVPITQNDLAPAVVAYEGWVRRRLTGLIAETRALDADVRHGDLAAAKEDWLTAHLRYETLGAAYGAFGDDDTAINAIPSPTVAPATDPRLHGFHRIEAMLWTGRTAGLARETVALVRAVRHLRTRLATQQVIAPIEVGLRAHEILEDTVGHVLTGFDDAGSHSGLATIDANIVGTRHALAPLLPLLRSRDPRMDATRRWLDRTQAFVRRLHQGSGWPPLASLGRTDRETLDADLTQTVELLAHVAVITDPRRGAQ